VHDRILLQEHRQFLVRTAAERERRVHHRLAVVFGRGRIEALGFIKGGAQVGEGFEFGEAWGHWDAGAVDFLLEFPEDVGALGEGEEEAGEEGLGGVPAGEQDVEEFGAESGAVLGGLDDVGEEGGSLVGVVFGVGGVLVCDGLSDHAIYIVVHELFSLLEAEVWQE